MDPVRGHEHGIGAEQGGDLVLVGLELVECPFQGRVLVAGILQLHDYQRQAVDEQHDIRASVVLMFDHRVLVHCQPVIGLDIVEIDQPGDPPADAAVLAGDLDLHTFDQVTMQAPVLLGERGGFCLLNLAQHLFQRLGGQVRVEAFKGFPETLGQHNLAVAGALGRKSFRGDVRPVQNGIAEPGEPFESSILDIAFGEPDHFVKSACHIRVG